MYDFKSLSSYDFELLVRDLLQKKVGVIFESFKSGRDKGIDLRYSENKQNNIIVQCKHYAGTGVRGLIASLKKEVKKVNKLQPVRYIVATSVGLTPENKKNILKMFTPYCNNTGDILGNEDLNNLLTIHQDIEKIHYKLWLTSTSLLEMIVHSGIYNQTKIMLEGIQDKAKYYVQNKSFYEATKILSEHNYCIISGIPGIGKTFLAEILLLEYAGREYEPVVVGSNIKEAFDTLNHSKKQVFYYDDFLGQTGWEDRLEKNEDQKILNFIKYAEKHNQTKFILTTREYILQQSKNIYEKLNAVQFDSAKCIIQLEDYNRINRAHILFNHLFFSDIPKDYIFNLIKKETLLKIIDHKNYSPRIIEWMSSYVNIKEYNFDEYVAHFLQTLENPKNLWLHAFRKHISPPARSLLFVLMTFRYGVDMQSLKNAYYAFRKEEIRIYGGSISADELESSLDEMEGSFVKIQLKGDHLYVSYHNPSVLDFMEDYMLSNVEIFRIIMDSLVYYQQFITVTSRGGLTARSRCLSLF